MIGVTMKSIKNKVDPIQDLNKEICSIIKRIFENDFRNISYVENLPFFCFHVNFKKKILEELLIDAISNGEVENETLNVVYKMFNIKRAPKDFNGIKIEHFRLSPYKAYTGFNLDLFVDYTNYLENMIKKTTYSNLLDTLRAVTCDEISVDYLLNENELDYDELERNIEIMNDAPEHYRWFEIKESDNGNIFYKVNSDVVQSFYSFKNKKTNNSEDIRKTKKKFLSCFEPNDNEPSMAYLEVFQYYRCLFSVLTHDIFDINKAIILNTLSYVFSMLLKMHLNMEYSNTTRQIRKNKVKISNQEISDIARLDYKTFGKHIAIYDSTLPDIATLYHISSKLKTTPSSLLGTKNIQTMKENYEDTENAISDYITKKYGLTQNTLEVLEFWQKYNKLPNVSEPDKIQRFNDALNSLLCRQSIAKDIIDAKSPGYIMISSDEIKMFKEIISEGEKLKSNSRVEEIIEKDISKKTKGDLVVRWNASTTVYNHKKKNIKIKISSSNEEYSINRIKITHSKSEKKVYISKGEIKNIVFLPSAEQSILETDLNVERLLIIGEYETDFITPMIEFFARNINKHN